MQYDTSRTFLLGVAAAAAVVIGVISALSTLQAYSLGGNPNTTVRGFINPREHSRGAIRPSSRNEQFEGLQRDTAMELRIQKRLVNRIHQNAEEVLRSSAAEEEELVNDVREYFRARRRCVLNGYTHARRLGSCIEEGGNVDRNI